MSASVSFALLNNVSTPPPTTFTPASLPPLCLVLHHYTSSFALSPCCYLLSNCWLFTSFVEPFGGTWGHDLRDGGTCTSVAWSVTEMTSNLFICDRSCKRGLPWYFSTTVCKKGNFPSRVDSLTHVCTLTDYWSLCLEVPVVSSNEAPLNVNLFVLTNRFQDDVSSSVFCFCHFHCSLILFCDHLLYSSSVWFDNHWKSLFVD